MSVSMIVIMQNILFTRPSAKEKFEPEMITYVTRSLSCTASQSLLSLKVVYTLPIEREDRPTTYLVNRTINIFINGWNVGCFVTDHSAVFSEKSLDG